MLRCVVLIVSRAGGRAWLDINMWFYSFLPTLFTGRGLYSLRLRVLRCLTVIEDGVAL